MRVGQQTVKGRNIPHEKREIRLVVYTYYPYGTDLYQGTFATLKNALKAGRRRQHPGKGRTVWMWIEHVDCPMQRIQHQ